MTCFSLNNNTASSVQHELGTSSIKGLGVASFFSTKGDFHAL